MKYTKLISLSSARLLYTVPKRCVRFIVTSVGINRLFCVYYTFAEPRFSAKRSIGLLFSTFLVQIVTIMQGSAQKTMQSIRNRTDIQTRSHNDV